MNPDELTLPNTLNADALTQSQEVVPSQVTQTPIIWGRLCPNKEKFVTIEMTNDVYSAGRSDKCDIVLSLENMKQKWLSVISKVHFKITREFIDSDSLDTVVYLEDLSHNGTFVNKQLVGKNKKTVLENNDVISLAQPVFAVYIFMSTTGFEGSGLPSELKCKYAVSRTLGSGACGEVKMVFTKSGCKRFAMKTITKRIFTNGYKHPLNDPEKIMNEVRILKALRHPCVIRMEEIVDTPSTVYIVLELMEGGELLDRIVKKNGLSERNTKILFYQIVLAVHYLHDRGITHRDLKPENILLASDGDVTLVKVSDFGLSKLVDQQTMMKTFCGTPMYVAPEILLTGGQGTYTSQVDIWSLGVILYCCLSALTPFNAQNKDIPLQEQIIRGIYRFPSSKFSNVSDRALDLIRQMLTVDSKKRITINQVLLHQWLADREMRTIVDKLLTAESDENFDTLIPRLDINNRDVIGEGLRAAMMKRARIE